MRLMKDGPMPRSACTSRELCGVKLAANYTAKQMRLTRLMGWAAENFQTAAHFRSLKHRFSRAQKY